MEKRKTVDKNQPLLRRVFKFSLDLILFGLLFLGGTSQITISQDHENDNVIINEQLDQSTSSWDDFYHQSVKIMKVGDQSSFGKMSEKQVRKVLYWQVQGTPLADYIEKDGMLLQFLVKWMMDEKAVTGVFHVTQQQEKLKRMFYLFLALSVVSLLAGATWRYLRPKQNFFKRLFLVASFRISLFIGYLVFFYYQFADDLAPTWQIAKSVINH